MPDHAPTPRAWTDAELELVARTIHDHACPSDQAAGCNWTEDGTECRLGEFEGFAAAALDALTARGWVNLSRVSGYEIDGEMHRPDDVRILMRPEADHG